MKTQIKMGAANRNQNGKRVMAMMLFAVMLLLGSQGLKAQIKGCKRACNLVANGSFDAGNTGFTSELPLGCNNCTAGSICVVNLFRDKCDRWPATGGTGRFLAVDGSPIANNKLIWKKDMKSACEGVTYTFSFKAANIFPEAPVSYTFIVNGNPLLGGTVSVSGSAWTTYSVTFTATTPITSIALRQDIGAAKSDIGIDDIFFGFCVCDCRVQ